jgi:hypothetical protein
MPELFHELPYHRFHSCWTAKSAAIIILDCFKAMLLHQGHNTLLYTECNVVYYLPCTAQISFAKMTLVL